MKSFRIILSASCALTLTFALVACSGTKKDASAAGSGRAGTGMAVPVTVATAAKRDVPLEIDAIGTVEPINMVQVSRRLPVKSPA